LQQTNNCGAKLLQPRFASSLEADLRMADSPRLGTVRSGALTRTRKPLEEREIIEIAQREQQRIGNDLHDGLGQDLTGIALMLRAIGAQLRKEGSSVCSDIDDVIGLVNAAIENTRALARGLSPVGSERDALSTALQALAGRATERYGIPVTFQSRTSHSPQIDQKSATHLYRIAQEALTNAMRHGRATRVKILLSASGNRLRLNVTDNGRGFGGGAPNAGDGLGLKIMHHRAEMLAGRLSFSACASGGTVVRFYCPLNASRPGKTARRAHRS
jgi:two-component system, NarL family, sensor histidine kinase UhpB